MIDSWNAAKLNERITQVENKIQPSLLPVPEVPTEAYFNGTNWIAKSLVWENDSPSTASTGVSDIDVSDYSYIDIIYISRTTIPVQYKVTVPVVNTSGVRVAEQCYMEGGENTYTISWLFRTLTISEGVLSISGCNKRNVISGVYSAGASNTDLIPLKIYGY